MADALADPQAHAHPPGLAHHFASLAQQKEATSLGMWVFLVTEVMFFGGLFATYVVYRNLYPEVWALASQHLDARLGAINTAVLIGSSLTMALAVRAAALGGRRTTALFLALTILLGGVFLGVKAVEYRAKFEHHLVPGPHFHFEGNQAQQAQLFFSLYFAMTGLHATHMVAGIVLLAILAGMAWRGRFGRDNHTAVELLGLYWHFVDIVWIFLFPLLYLIPEHLAH